MVWSLLATTYIVGKLGQKDGKPSIISLSHVTSEFSCYTALREDRGTAQIPLCMTGVVFQIKKELPSLHTQACTHANTTSSFSMKYCSHAEMLSLTFTSKARLTARSVCIFRLWVCRRQTLWHDQQNHIPFFCLLSRE